MHVYQVAPEFTRKTTVVHLRPEPYFRHIGPEGLGEDVTYDARRARAAPLAVARPARRLDARVVLGAPRRARPLPGRRAGAARLPRLPPLGVRVGRARPGAAAGAASRLGEALGREYRDVTFVSSTRATALDDWLALYPDLRFKLDPTPEWTDERARDARGPRQRRRRRPEGPVQGHGRRQPGRPRALPARRRGLPGRVDRGSRRSTPETDAVLEPHRDRITWDAPIHSWADVEALPFAPKCLNVQAVALRLARAAVRVLRPLRRRRASRSTAAASSSSASAAARSSSSPALFSCRRPERRRARRLQRERAAGRPRDEPAAAAARALRLQARRPELTAARAFASARRSAGSSIRANASSHVSHSAACTSAASGASVAGRDDEEAQVEVVVLVPRDPVHVDVEQAGARERGRRGRSPRAPRAAPPSASDRVARLEVAAGLEPGAALAVVDEQRPRAASVDDDGRGGEVRPRLVARERIARASTA